MKRCLTAPLNKYPVPDIVRRGHYVSYFTYSNLNDAKRASALAEQIATQRWHMNGVNIYAWPGEIVVNKDKTFTVVVV